MARKWGPSMIMNYTYQVALILILVHYLFNGAEDRRKQQCMKPLTQSFKIRSPLTAYCFDCKIDLTVVHTTFAILLNSAFLTFLKLLPDQEAEPENDGLLSNLFDYSLYFGTCFIRFYGWYSANQHLPLVFQTANIWERNLVFTIIQGQFFVAFIVLVPPLVDHYFMSWDRMDRAIRRWNRREFGRISAITLLCIIVQAMLVTELFWNAAIWATQSNEENLEAFTYFTFRISSFKFTLISEFYEIVYKIYSCLFLSVVVSSLITDEELEQLFTTKDLVEILFAILVVRLIAMGFYYDSFDDRDYSLHNHAYQVFNGFTYLVILLNLVMVSYMLVYIAYLILNWFLGTLVPDHERVDLAKKLSKKEYYFSKERSQIMSK